VDEWQPKTRRVLKVVAVVVIILGVTAVLGRLTRHKARP
jgi:glucose uptake protein GlcU